MTKNLRRAMALLITVALLVISPATTSFAATGSTYSDTYSYSSYSEMPSGFTQVSGSPICFYEGTPDSVQQDVLASYATLPDNVRHLISISDFHIMVLDRAHAGVVTNFNDPGYAIAGETMQFSYVTYSNGSITHSDFAAVVFYDVAGTSAGQVLLHEIGHMVDDSMLMYCNEQSSQTAEFAALASQYQSVIATYDANASANVYNNSEIFAEVFRIHVTNPGWLSANCPELESYMSGLIAGLPSEACVNY